MLLKYHLKIARTYMHLQLAKQQHSDLICFNVVFVETTMTIHLAHSVFLWYQCILRLSCSSISQKSQMVDWTKNSVSDYIEVLRTFINSKTRETFQFPQLHSVQMGYLHHTVPIFII